MTDIESSDKELVKILVDDDVTEKGIAAPTFHSQTFRREGVWLTIFQIDELQKPLKAGLQKQKIDLLQSEREKSTSTVLE